MRQHRNLHRGDVEKKNSFFYHAVQRSFCRVANKVVRRGRLKGRDFKNAESFAERDRICRLFAAECYDLAVKFSDAGKIKVSLQYAKLAAKLLGLSLKPKKLQDLEEIKKALAELQTEGTRSA
jgi:hypothetical protein